MKQEAFSRSMMRGFARAKVDSSRLSRRGLVAWRFDCGPTRKDTGAEEATIVFGFTPNKLDTLCG